MTTPESTPQPQPAADADAARAGRGRLWLLVGGGAVIAAAVVLLIWSPWSGPEVPGRLAHAVDLVTGELTPEDPERDLMLLVELDRDVKMEDTCVMADKLRCECRNAVMTIGSAKEGVTKTRLIFAVPKSHGNLVLHVPDGRPMRVKVEGKVADRLRGY
ncbi:MAG: hypothetical protein BIFFINMI_01559 [Phycisphaerae bacterium]|nr:hypothetical protein [Phycisphaerae bacterium]